MRFLPTGRFTALALFLAIAPRGAAQTVPVFIFAGQSNMVGYATDFSELTLAQQAPQPNVLYAGQHQNPVAWSSINGPTQVNPPNPPNPFDPVQFQVYSGQGIGAEFSAPLTISNANFGQTVGAVKYALNIYGLRQDGGQDDWAPASGELYPAMVSRVNSAVSQLPVQQPGMTGQVSGFFWIHGERDAQDADRAELYQANLVNFITTVRSQFGANVPFVLARMINDNGGGSYPEFQTVRRAQENVARLLPNVALVDADDIQRGSASIPVGEVHYSAQGTYELGVRMGRAYLDLVNPLPSGPASMNLSVNGSFEDYAIGGFAGFPGNHPVTTQPYPANPMPGWTSGTAAGHTLVRNGAFGGVAASAGQQFLSLENGMFGSGNGGAQQTFATTNGQLYHVFFDYSAIARGDNATVSFTYDRNGTGTTTINVDTNLIGQDQMVPWQSTSFNFTAGAGASNTIRFLPTVTGDDGTFYGPAIDNVKIIQGSVWTGTEGNNNWGTDGNWSGPNPNSNTSFANFLWNTANFSVNLNQGRSLKSLRFDSPTAYTISGGSVLDLRSAPGAGNVSILVARGNHTVNSRINFGEAPVDIDIAQDASLTMNGTFTNNNGSTRTLSKFGAGSLILGHVNNTYAGATRVVGGTLRLANGGTSNNISLSPSITVYRGATFDTSGLSGGGITLAANQDLIGAGSVRGGVNATASGVNLSPGHSPGIMTFAGTGNITLGINTVLDIEIGGVGTGIGDAGYNFDQIRIDGAGKTLVTGGARLNLIELAGRASNQPYTIISAVNGASIDSAGLLRDLNGVLNEGVVYADGAWDYVIDYEPGSITLTFVPEPSSMVGWALLGVWGLLRKSRR